MENYEKILKLNKRVVEEYSIVFLVGASFFAQFFILFLISSAFFKFLFGPAVIHIVPVFLISLITPMFTIAYVNNLVVEKIKKIEQLMEKTLEQNADKLVIEDEDFINSGVRYGLSSIFIIPLGAIFSGFLSKDLTSQGVIFVIIICLLIFSFIVTAIKSKSFLLNRQKTIYEYFNNNNKNSIEFFII